MKLPCIIGTGSGRLGGSVFVVRKGEQIVRTYQPKVQNPKSVAQAEQRAKMKAAVQLSAVLSDAISPFKGFGGPNVSARNAFVSDLFKRGAVTYDSTANNAVIDRAAIRISPSAIAWRLTSSLTATGSVVSGTVSIFTSAVKEGSVLTMGVLHNEENGTPVLLGLTSLDVSSETVSVNISVGEHLGTGDSILMVLSVPRDEDMARRYRSIMWDGTANAYKLAVVSTAYTSAFDHLASYNNVITITGREMSTKPKTNK